MTQIKSLGYATLEAANAAEALAIIDADRDHRPALHRRHHAGPHERPPAGRRGGEAAADLKTLFTSGYTENAIVHHGRLDSGVLLLAKPYRKSELAKMLRTALAS